MKDNQPISMHHPPETLIAAYAIGKCSLMEQAEIDEHCFTCEECRTRLSILLRLCATEGSVKEQRELEKLFPLGVETIAQARFPVNHVPSQSLAKDAASFAFASRQSQPKSKGILGTLTDILLPKHYIALAASILVIAAVGVFYYWHVKINSPVQNSMMAMRRSYRSSRPLEARVTELPYKPYERTRGAAPSISESIDVDRDQINYALAELTHIVASNPTPDARHALGRLYLLLGEFIKAEEQLTEALKSSPQNAKIHADLAAVYYERSKFDPYPALSNALKHYDSAIRIDPQLAEAWFNRALCNEEMGRDESARKDWERYLELDSNSEWAEEAKAHLKKLEIRAAEPINPKNSEVLSLQKALATNDEYALRNIVSSNFSIVRQFSTDQLLENYLDASAKGDLILAETYLKNLRQIGKIVANEKSDFFISNLTEFAARASPQTKSGMQRVRLMLRQADQELSRSLLDVAYSLYENAYHSSERIGDPYHAELAALYLIRYYNINKKDDKLAELGLRLISQSERQHHRYIQAQASLAMANSYISVLQIARSLEYSLKAEKIAKELGDNPTILSSLRLSSGAYARTGDYDRSLNKNFEALSFMKEQPVTPLHKAQIYLLTGEILFYIGDYNLSLDYLKDSLQTSTRTNNKVFIAGSTGRIGLVHWKLGHNKEAIQYLNDALLQSKSIKDQTSRQLLQVELYTALGDILLDQNQPDRAIEEYHRAKTTIAGTKYRTFLSAVNQGLASAFIAQGKISEAEIYLRKSISLTERDRIQIDSASGRSAFLSSRQDVYRSMIDFQFNIKRNSGMAFNYAEKSKGRDMLDLISQNADTKEMDGRMVVSLSGDTSPLTLNRIQQALPDNIQILSYAITNKQVIIWHITRYTFSSSSVGLSSEYLQNVVSNYLTNLRTRRDIATVNHQGEELFEYLISPIRSHLVSGKLLCIIPDGALNQLPFATLYYPDKKRYLVEDFPISTTPSTSILVRTFNLAKEKSTHPSESFLGVSNPRFDHNRFPQLPTLPSSEEEISQSCSLYNKALILNKANATESEFINQIETHEIVHIASHTLIDSQVPLQSSIVLADETPRKNSRTRMAGHSSDGVLQAMEIYKLKLPKTRLVIMSSCRSALGDYTRGEALGALSQAFFAAKVPSVVATLWEADDVSAAEIMYSFHRNYRIKQYGFAESLRQAQQEQIHSEDIKKRHPYYWASFLITGDGLGGKPHST
ncbi:MAG: CHAT domain-containing protein [Blastocatellales bacterium]